MFLRGPLGCPFVGVPGRYLWRLLVVGWGMQVLGAMVAAWGGDAVPGDAGSTLR